MLDLRAVIIMLAALYLISNPRVRLGLLRSSSREHSTYLTALQRSSKMASTIIPISINLNPTFGAAFIGIVFAAIFHGITILQGIFYYRTYPKDRIFLKLLVALLLIMDTLSLALATQGVYTYLVSDFGNLAAIYSPVALGISNEPIVDCVVSSTVQLFQAYRIRVLDQRWWPLSIVIGVLSVFGFANAIAAVVISDTQISSLFELTKLK
ncbi:hypothetical protein J3R82DRAFT_10164 [Butyriboletus roseoflavus]|nr:hypothetical protein J3R82DRAFT_10164 [Butyriboletus roseoflavus]